MSQVHTIAPPVLPLVTVLQGWQRALYPRRRRAGLVVSGMARFLL